MDEKAKENTADEPATAPADQQAETPTPSGTPSEVRKPHPNKVAFNELQALYPELFNLRRARPLKIGIHKDLAEDGKLSKTRIRRALNFYVRQLAYIRSVARGGQRWGLNGPDGEVSADDQSHARERVKEIEEKRRAKRKAEGQPPRNRSDRRRTDPAPGEPKESAENKTGKPQADKKPSDDKPGRRKDRERTQKQPPRDPAKRMEEKLANLAERFNQN